MIELLDFRKEYESKQDFPLPPLKGCPDDLSAIEYVVEKKVNEIISRLNILDEAIQAFYKDRLAIAEVAKKVHEELKGLSK
jgi:hypothetical protein